MAMQWTRRAGLAAAMAATLLLAACGGGNTVASKLSPARIITFGDAMGDLGQTGALYTVNDATVNNWTQFVAGSYGQVILPSNQGGTSYAIGNARVVATPDVVGNASTPTVARQIDTFLAASTPATDDLILVSAGTSDVIAEVQSALAGTQTSDQAIANAQQAGRDLAAQIKRLVAAGARHVAVAGPYNVGRSPWATETNAGSLMEAASSGFNQQMLVALVNEGANVLYVDAALYYNTLSANGGSGITNQANIACNSIDPGPGIGTGAGQINSRLCTPATIYPGVDYNTFLFADRVYPTPKGQQLFGDYARGRITERW